MPNDDDEFSTRDTERCCLLIIIGAEKYTAFTGSLMKKSSSKNNNLSTCHLALSIADAGCVTRRQHGARASSR